MYTLAISCTRLRNFWYNIHVRAMKNVESMTYRWEKDINKSISYSVIEWCILSFQGFKVLHIDQDLVYKIKIKNSMFNEQTY